MLLNFARNNYTQSKYGFKKKTHEWNLSTPFSMHNRAAMCELRN